MLRRDTASGVLGRPPSDVSQPVERPAYNAKKSTFTPQRLSTTGMTALKQDSEIGITVTSVS